MRLSEFNNHSFWDHAEELRGHLLWCIAAWILCVLILFPLTPYFIRYAGRPVGRLMFLSPAEAFTIRFQISMILGFIVAFPVWVYGVLHFLWKGLKEKERRALLWATAFVAVLSCMGMIFADAVLIPLSLKFLLQFGKGVLSPMLTAHYYFSFYFSILFFCCLIFNTPFVIISLAFFRILRQETLRKYRKHVCVACFIIGAVLTPPDIVTQLLMALPLYMLYELSIFGARILQSKGMVDE